MSLVVRGQATVWSPYRRLRIACTLLWVGAIPVIVSLNLFGGGTGFFAGLALGYLFLLAVVSIRFTSWPCPRCGKPFVYRMWRLSSPMDLLPGRPCKHCGLPEGSNGWEES
jgi:hypothetical protein